MTARYVTGDRHLSLSVVSIDLRRSAALINCHKIIESNVADLGGGNIQLTDFLGAVPDTSCLRAAERHTDLHLIGKS